MIFADTDIFSALAKVGRLSLLFTLLRVTRLQIVPGVFKEIAHSVALGRTYTAEILALISTAQIEVLALTEEETVFCTTLPSSLGTGERESIAIARARQGTVLSNEARVAHYCRQYQDSVRTAAGHASGIVGCKERRPKQEIRSVGAFSTRTNTLRRKQL